MLHKKIQTFILDTLFPISCLSCGAPNVWLCPECFSKIKILSSQVCPYCEKVFTENGTTCPSCRINFLKKNDRPPLDGLIVAARYTDGPLARLVHTFKYNFVQDLALPLGNLLTKAATINDSPLPDLIVPVPLHPRRLRWRGFNQSEKLADQLSQDISPGMIIPMEKNIVRRQSYTPPQMKIKNYSERRKNLAGAFTINPLAGSKDLTGKNILLVDDICTTGSTLFECARVLKSAGAKKVYAIVLARQEIEKKK